MTEIVSKLVFKRWGRPISGVSKSILYSSGRLVLRLVLLSIVCRRACKIGFTLKVTSAPLCSSKGKYLQNWIISPKPCSSYAKNCLPFKLCLPSQIRLTLAGATIHTFFLNATHIISSVPLNCLARDGEGKSWHKPQHNRT